MEIVIRAAVMFVFLWAVTRAVGRSTLGELSTFELLMYVTMGDLIQQSVTQQDDSVTSGVLAISVFALLTVVLSWLQWRFPRTRSAIRGKPVVVVRNGHLLPTPARQQRFTESDLLATARQQGIRDLADIASASSRPMAGSRSSPPPPVPPTGHPRPELPRDVAPWGEHGCGDFGVDLKGVSPGVTRRSGPRVVVRSHGRSACDSHTGTDLGHRRGRSSRCPGPNGPRPGSLRLRCRCSATSSRWAPSACRDCGAS